MTSEGDKPVFQSSLTVLGREISICSRLTKVNKELVGIQNEYEERMARLSCTACKETVAMDWWKRNKNRYEKLWNEHLKLQFELKNHLFMI